MACVGEFTPEIETAAERENFIKSGRLDLHLARQLEGRSRPRQHGRALSARMRGRKKKYSLHDLSMRPAGTTGDRSSKLVRNSGNQLKHSFGWNRFCQMLIESGLVKRRHSHLKIQTPLRALLPP
jgi:hypothetical protein